MADPTGHWGKEIHENLTKKIAEGMGFSKQDAYLIAKGCNGADHYEANAEDWKLKISKIPNYNKSIL